MSDAKTLDRVLAHDLKTPLTGIGMVLGLLSEQRIGPLNDQQAKLVDQARLDCEKLRELIEQHTSQRKEGTSA